MFLQLLIDILIAACAQSLLARTRAWGSSVDEIFSTQNKYERESHEVTWSGSPLVYRSLDLAAAGHIFVLTPR
ncbi:MAG: hypothetical protein ACI80S_000144 [Pseudohongiellaceae bacterium]|jgi:hypothetical protein